MTTIRMINLSTQYTCFLNYLDIFVQTCDTPTVLKWDTFRFWKREKLIEEIKLWNNENTWYPHSTHPAFPEQAFATIRLSTLSGYCGQDRFFTLMFFTLIFFYDRDGYFTDMFSVRLINCDLLILNQVTESQFQSREMATQHWIETLGHN